MTATITDIGIAEVLRKRAEMMGKQAQVYQTILQLDFPYYRDPVLDSRGSSRELIELWRAHVRGNGCIRFALRRRAGSHAQLS